MTTLVGLDLAGRRVLVVGAGMVGMRRARRLLEDGAQVLLVDPTPSDDARRVVSHGDAELLDISEEAFDRCVAINLKSCVWAARHVIPIMRTQKSGAIINISSTAGLHGVNGLGAYCASKWAVRGLTKVAAMELGLQRIRVNSIHPGIIATPLVLKDVSEEGNAHVVGLTPLGRMGQPAEIAHGALFLASDESSFVTGAEIVADGGFTAG